MKRAAALALLIAGAAQAASVGDLTENNGRAKTGRFVVKTPGILRIGETRTVPADARAALPHYDAVIALSPDPALRAEAMRRGAWLRLELAQAQDQPDDPLLREAAALYERALKEAPGDAGNDRTLYQLSRVRQLLGDAPGASDALQQLCADHPASLLAGDAHFRAAELLFMQKRYAAASAQYTITVAQGAASAYFEPAQYKLAWALYLQERHGDALEQFLAIIERNLPAGALDDPQAALARVAPAHRETTADALHAADLSLMALGGGAALAQHFGGGEPGYAALLYRSLAQAQLDKHRWSDAAATYSLFSAQHPQHALSAAFQSQAIEAYARGGFGEQVIAAKTDYVRRYAADLPRWQAQAMPDDIRRALRQHAEDVGKYHQALAQASTDAVQRRAEFLAAGAYYRDLLRWYPQDAQAMRTSLLYADTLLDAGSTGEAAAQYQAAAARDVQHPLAAEAAYAAVQAWQMLARETKGGEREDALRQSVAASLFLADRFPAHAQWLRAVGVASGNLHDLGEHREAIALAQRGLGHAPDAAQRAELLDVAASSSLALNDYAGAEAALTALVQADAASRTRNVERLALAVYRQGEAARAAGELRAAAEEFLRVGRVAPDSGIRATADYDASAMLIRLEDWNAATTLLEAFRQRNAGHTLLPEIDRKLALAYQKAEKPGEAAQAYARIAARKSEDDQTRREAGWLAAQLNDAAGYNALAVRAYENYLAGFDGPPERRLRALRRLADMALQDRADEAIYLKRLRELVAAAGNGGDAQTRLLAARASLDIGRTLARQADGIALRAPFDSSLARRRRATDEAIAALLKAAGYDYAEVTPAASYEIGSIYRSLARALLRSERPGKLSSEEREQYDVLLEEQAFPFEEKSIAAHEANLARVAQGLWSDWIRRSTLELAELAPVKYGKHEANGTIYENLR